MSATSLLISEKSRDKPLEDDTVYSRHNIIAINKRTFENIVLRKIYPLIIAGPGGYYVEIDGKAIKRRRQKLGLSIGELAGMTGVSRRTLYGYEQGMAKASVSTAYNLICTLGMPVASPIDVFKKRNDQTRYFLDAAKEAIVGNKLLRKIFIRLARYNITAVQRAPFDFLINSEEETKIIGGVVDDREEELNMRVHEIMSFSKVVQAHPILLTEKQKVSYEEIPCICDEELSTIHKPEDLVQYSK
jgi:putative transcriptional regulator